ncbi:MAG: transketolase C-terminal domain-containing protein, partial [Chloroflexota bacterium]|nr:transketolase C-terminal domain-containing protein [Chloroflexota bacterium]
MRELNYLQAIREAQFEEMKRDPKVFIMGEDITYSLYGTTAGFLEEFGAERVRNTPISESGFTGVGIGAALVGMRPIVDYAIASFIFVAMDQLISMAAKVTYMYGGQTKVPIVFRAVTFYGGGNAAQHSDRPYPSLMNVPGLKIITPATPYDMKGLLKSAIRDDDPVFCFEDGTVLSSSGPVPEEEYLVPIGVGDIKREGTDVTIVGIAGCVALALQAAEALAQEGISAEVIDPRTLVPMDKNIILESVSKTGR